MKYHVKGTVDLYEEQVPFKATFDLDEDSIMDLAWGHQDKVTPEILTEYVMNCYGPFAITIEEFTT